MSVNPLERVDGLRPYEIQTSDPKTIATQHALSNLSYQNEYLQKRNRDLETQLEKSITAEAFSRRHAQDAAIEKQTLAENLREVDMLAERLKIDKHRVIEVADKELNEAKVELSKSRMELEKQDLELAKLRSEVLRLTQDNRDLENSLTLQTNDMCNLETLVDKLQQDKMKLSLRVNQLTTTEKKLVLEIEKFSKKGSMQMAAKRGRSPNRFDQFIKNLEQERDYWKTEVDTLQQVLKYRKIGETTGVTSISTSLTRSRSRSPKKIPAKQSLLEAALKAAEDERDHYKRELDLEKSLKSRPQRHLSPSDLPSSGVSTELHRVIRERDELQTLLDKFERHMSEIQANVKVLTSERDRLAQLYEDSKDEIQRMRHDLLKTTTTHTSPPIAIQRLLRQTEQERDDALVDLRKLVLERDSLRERLKILADSNLADKARLEQQVDDVSLKLRAATNERNQAEMQLSNMRNHISKIEEDLRLQLVRCQDINDQCEQHKSTISKMRLLAEEREQNLTDCQKRLLLTEDELNRQINQSKALEDRLIVFERHTSELSQEIDQLKSRLANVNDDKQSLTVKLLDRQEHCQKLDTDLKNYKELTSRAEAQTRDLVRKFESIEDMLGKREKEVLRLKKESDELKIRIEDLNNLNKSKARENKALESDLTTLTNENRNLKADVNNLFEERQQLVDQLKEYVSEVHRVEQVLAQREDERSRLLEQYKNLSVESDNQLKIASQLETEKSNLRSDITNKDTQVKKLHERIELFEKECAQNSLAQQALEGQICKQKKIISSLEDKLSSAERDKYSLKQSIADAKDLNFNLDNNCSGLQRQLAGKDLEIEKTRAILGDMERELSNIKEKYNNERQRLTSLEQVIATNRDKDFQNQLSLQESASEIQLLRDRLAVNDSKIDSQNREVGQLRNKITELEADLERSKRNATNERFEKERLAQEVRRLADAPTKSLSAVSTRISTSPIGNNRLLTSTGSSLASGPIDGLPSNSTSSSLS